MAVSAPTSTANDFSVTSTPAAASTSDSTVTADRFLKLLVAQMQNQDPLSPMDNAQVTSQMAQINTVTGIDKLNSTVQGLSTQFMQLQAVQGASLVGRDVIVAGNKLSVDAEGYVTYSNVNAVEEMVNMISASRSYQNNLEVMNTAKSLLLKTIQLGQS